MKYPTNADTGEYLDPRAAADFTRVNGANRRPQAPRNPQAQSGSRKVLVTWDAPLVTDGILGYKIYKDTESQLLDTLNDPNVRQYSVPSSAGSSPPTINIFISSFTKRDESQKVQVQGAATAESGAPTDPSVPTDSGASGKTGASIDLDGGSDAGITR
jgi:hypothetical protein